MKIEKRGKGGIGKNRRGLSPVIATILLIAMTLALALIVFLWFRSFNQEAVTKFGGTNIDVVCQQVQFDASYDSGSDTLSISNLGNVPIYSFSLQVQKTGNEQTIDITDPQAAGSSWPKVGLPVGAVFSGGISGASGASSITVIPVLRGTSSSGIKTHVCSSQYGKQLTV